MWREPARGALPDPSFYSLSGIDQARALMRILIPRPPTSHLTGIRLSQVGSGTAVCRMPASPWLRYGDGTVDTKMLLGAVLDIAVLTGAPPASDVLTASLSVNHLRPCTMEGEAFVARARVIHSGSTFTLAEVLVEDALGRGVAHATGSHVIKPLDPPPPPATKELPPVVEPHYDTPDPCMRPFPEQAFDVDQVWSAWSRSCPAEEVPRQPIQDLLGIELVEMGEGTMTVTMPASDWLRARSRQVAAGPVACLTHFTLTGAATTLSSATQRVGIIDQTITFLRPIVADGRTLMTRAWISYQVGDTNVAVAEVTDADGNVVAVGHQTSRLRERRRQGALATTPERVLATVVFTDIVGSTRRAEEMGDTPWRQLLADHDDAVRRQLGVWKGREVKTTGDGFLVSFDSPARALQCARAIRDNVKRLGLELRIGVHTGECEAVGSDLAGIGVHIASRLQSAAEPGEILVSGTVRDLVTGSGLRFTDRGCQQLKGIEGERSLFALEG